MRIAIDASSVPTKPAGAGVYAIELIRAMAAHDRPDGYAAFAETGDPFEPGLAAKLKAIYSAGDTADPMQLYRAFRGREPAIGPLLQQRGLEPAMS